MNKKQRGFSAVEVILVIIVIAILIFVGWYAWKARHKDDKPSISTSAAKPQEPMDKDKNKDEYAGWKTYTSSGEGFSVKYPADWSMKKGSANSSGTFDASMDAVSFTGPNGFSVGYSIFKPVTSVGCQNCKFTVLDNVTLKDKPGYVVINSNTFNGNMQGQTLSISKAKTYEAQSDQGWPYYNSIKDPQQLVVWKGAYPQKCMGEGNCQIQSMSLDEFRQKPEVQTAEKILRSIIY